MAFINREKELDYLTKLFGAEPKSILILYGPKSCGKTTLMLKLIEQLDKEKYAVNYLDLRQVLIYDFKSFLKVFLTKSSKEKTGDIFSSVTLNTGFFSVSADDETKLENSPFKVMSDKLAAAKNRGIKPIIIIDEIQMLRHFYLNDERYLLNELFNFLVEMTQISKSAHVVLATPDSCFVEEILMENAELKKASQLCFIDHLEENDVKKWLENDKLSKAEINTAWKYLGGCPWDMVEMMRQRTAGISVDQYCQQWIERYTSHLAPSHIFKKYGKATGELYVEVTKKIADAGIAKTSEFDNYHANHHQLMESMASHDLWFYQSTRQEITANSKVVWWAMQNIK